MNKHKPFTGQKWTAYSIVKQVIFFKSNALEKKDNQSMKY